MAARSDIVLPEREEAHLLVWPTSGNPSEFLKFEKPAQWQEFIDGLGINPRIPDIVRVKFARAQLLYLMGWIDFSLVKAGELAALIALELALTDRYAAAIPKNRRSFAALLKYMVDADGLDDGNIPMVRRSGGTAIGQLTGEVRPTLAERRNILAHGNPFEGLPTGGLLELVRDLIDYSYRDYIAEVAVIDLREDS